MPYPHNHQIKDILKDMSDLVQREGLNYLIPRWQQFAGIYAATESSLYEWLNDLDSRKIIDEILDVLPADERTNVEHDLKNPDATVIANTFEINECVWGSEVEVAEGYNRKKNWYYYRMNESVFNTEPGRFTRRT